MDDAEAETAEEVSFGFGDIESINANLRKGDEVGHGLQLQSLWITPTAAVS